MKKKIGFIDLHIDEWHANNYPGWIVNSRCKGDFELGFAWEESPAPGGKNLRKWCEDFNMTPALSIEEVIEKSDAICVLAPSNPETHERLADLPLQSGKPLFIDKPFAPGRAAAKRIIQKAEAYHTPLLSSSALRFCAEFPAVRTDVMHGEPPLHVVTTGGGSNFDEYAIHQLEMIVSMLGVGAQNIMCTGNDAASHLVISYSDHRSAALSYHPGFIFTTSVVSANYGQAGIAGSGFFEGLIDHMLTFFQSGISPVPGEETEEIAALLECAIAARKTPLTPVGII